MRPASALLYQVLKRKPGGQSGQLSITVGKADRALLADAEVHEWLTQNRAEAFRSGTDGTAWELRMLARWWGFRLSQISVPVYLWHGTADPVTPLQMGKRLAQAIPGCIAIYCSGEGHHMLVRRWSEVLNVLKKRY